MKLPARPNLDQLRRQAKALLSGLESGDREAIATIQEHLPAAKGMSAPKVRQAGFRLADAQSAIARKSGFASWPRLARHVEQLRALEGTWEFETLEIAGDPVPAAAMASSRLLIDGDRFRTESPEAIYEGVFNIDVEAEPHGIDIEFIEGPEAGNWNYGLFRLDGDRLTICLDMSGKGRPSEFKTSAGTNHALETLRRASKARPPSVTGGVRGKKPAAAPEADRSGFEFVPSELLSRLQGEWSAASLSRDGQEIPAMMCKYGTRSAKDNEIKIVFGGQVMIHALVRLNAKTDPVEVDYCNIGGAAKGTIQQGIMKWEGKDACFCMASPGQPRPADFNPGPGRTVSRWSPKA